MKRRRIAAAVLLFAAVARGQVLVELPKAWKPGERPPRVVLFLVEEGKHVRQMPTAAPFYEEPQPVFGRDVKGEASVEFGDDAEGFIGAGAAGWGRMRDLRPGKYRVQAGLILSRAIGGGDWTNTPGNWRSAVEVMTWPMSGPLTLKCEELIRGAEWPADRKDVELFEIRSELLSKFAGRDVTMRAGVRLPTKREAGRSYAALYQVPGFSGDHFGVLLPRVGGVQTFKELREQVFEIYLNPSNENGHTLFLDSANNGPWGKALTEELIPALEKKYSLIAKPEARLLQGHSSGGWSTLWLATEYPHVFGATWSSSPDPVDFRSLERVNLYADENMYVDAAGQERPSKRGRMGQIDMTIRQENGVEHAMGPDRTSGQQWASWQACWGTKAGDKPAALFDPLSGKLVRHEAETYGAFDLVERLKKDPQRLAPLYRNHVRLIVGTRDDYFLDEPVRLLAAELARLSPTKAGEKGYVKFVEGATHATIYGSREMFSAPAEMLEHLKANCPEAIR